MTYFDELTRSMTMLAHHPKTLFVGQSVKYDGQAMHKTFDGVPMERRIEMPVAEDFQMGFCTGLALEGYIPVCIYPRMDFLICAANQLLNHLDKIPLLGGFAPKLIIRTAVGSTSPLDPGPQHKQNYTAAFNMILNTVGVYNLIGTDSVLPAYEEALKLLRPVIMVEHMELYHA